MDAGGGGLGVLDPRYGQGVPIGRRRRLGTTACRGGGSSGCLPKPVRRPPEASQAGLRCQQPQQGTGGWATYWAPELFLDLAVLASKSHSPEKAEETEEELPEVRTTGAQRWRMSTEQVLLYLIVPFMPQQNLTKDQGTAVHFCGGLCTWPAAPVAAGTACASFLFGLRMALRAGLGHALPPVVGAISALMAAAGSASCVVALNKAPTTDSVTLPPWTACALAGLCGLLIPVPLMPLSKASLASVAGPVRLALPGAVGAVVMFEIVHRYWARIDPFSLANFYEREHAGSAASWLGLSGPNEGLLPRVCRHWWRHFSLSTLPDRGIGAIFLLSHWAVTYMTVHIDLSMTQWRNGFFNILQARDLVGFHRQLWEFAPLWMASTLANIYSGYLTTMWDLRWREELTRDFVSLWLSQRSYYYTRFLGGPQAAPIDNFDQRIVEDTALFGSNSRSLICGVSEAAIRLAVFFPALLRLSPNPLVWQLTLVLSLASSLATHVVGHPLAARNGALQRAEADFRAALVRLRIFAEDIALQNGEEAENDRAARCFENVKAATWLAARGTLNLTVFTSAYGLAGSILPFLLLAPSYFHGAISLGMMFQIEGVIGGVRSSLDYFIGAYADIAEWRATAERLLALEACAAAGSPSPAAELQLADGAPLKPGAAGTHLEAEGLTVTGSGGDVLLEGVSFRWEAGDRILLLGSLGSGNTALLRILAGAWPPPAAGRVLPEFPRPGVLLLGPGGFLLPDQASLRSCLTYPRRVGASDEDLRSALRACGLDALAEQLDQEGAWATSLTPGDRQRLMFTRLLARWPSGAQWLLLDDADRDLDGPTALALHGLVADAVPGHVGVVVASRHPEVRRQLGWRRLRLSLEQQSLEELTGEEFADASCCAAALGAQAVAEESTLTLLACTGEESTLTLLACTGEEPLAKPSNLRPLRPPPPSSLVAVQKRPRPPRESSCEGKA